MRTLALTSTRVSGLTRSRRALAPLIAAGVLLAIVHAGGAAPLTEAYGASVLVLLPILAWQAKVALDVEPDVQRLLATTAVGSPAREVTAGLLAALAPAGLAIAAGLLVPWLVGAVESPEDGGGLAAGLVYGVWLHVLAALVGLAIGAWASRAISRDAGRATLTLVVGVVLVLALGSGVADPLGWAVPRLTALVRAGNQADVNEGALLSVHSCVWVVVVLAGYVRQRMRTRP